MELDSIKSIKFNVSMTRENAQGSRSAVVEIKVGADSIDLGDLDFTHQIDEEETLTLLRAARAWVEAHCTGLSAPYDIDNYRLSQTFSETDASIDLDSP